MEKKVMKHDTLEYVIRYPENFNEEEKYPLVIYVHGAGGRGTDINLIYGHGFFLDTEDMLTDTVSIAPQCYANSWFDIFEKLQDFIVYCRGLKFVDESRVYLIGASMGGYTTWQLAMSRPELFSAIVPICGGGMYWNGARLKDMPVWAFHGDRDKTVLPEESKKMVEKINAAGGNARLTIYPDTDHNAWTPTFRSRELWSWLLEQKK